jgi:hypothetical protein
MGYFNIKGRVEKGETPGEKTRECPDTHPNIP